MSRKVRVLGMLIVAAALAVVSIPAAFADANAGTGPGDAMPLGTGQTYGQVNPGQSIWYAFQYSGDSSQIQIDMPSTPTDAASFTVWTPANVADWVAGNGQHPIGAGTPNDRFNSDMFWSGNFDFPGTYYVEVQATGPNAAAFTLKVSGSGISGTTPAQ